MKPTNLFEAIRSLKDMIKYDSEDYNYIKALQENELVKLHHSLGRFIRNEFGLWDADSQLLKSLTEDVKSDHPDDVSQYIIVKFWEEINGKYPAVPQVVQTGKWLTFYTQNGYEYFHRHRKPNAVAIVAVTKDKKLVLVEQKRVPQDRPVVEIPAGLVDDGESFEQAATRELLEETGYGNGKVVEVVKDITTTPGICTEKITFVIILNVEKIAEGGGLAEENEFINVSLHNLEDDLYFHPEKIMDMKTLAGIMLVKEHFKFRYHNKCDNCTCGE